MKTLKPVPEPDETKMRKLTETEETGLLPSTIWDNKKKMLLMKQDKTEAII